MKRVLVVESGGHIPDVSLRVVSDHDTVAQARYFLRNEADDGTFSILTQVEADILVKTKQEVKRTLEGGQAFIQRGVTK